MRIRRLVGLAAFAAQVSFAAGVRSVEDVTAYGAVGDGRTDDTAAILKAEAAAWESGKPLFFPTNGVGSTYLTRKGVILVSGMTLTADRGAVLANASAVLQGGGRTLRIRLAKSAEKGDGVLALESTDGLVPGQEVTIYDTAKGGGYSETQADIASVDPDAGTVTIDTGRYSADDRNRGLFSRMPAGSACVLTDFSLVKTVQRKGRDAENVIVENITVRPYGNPGDPYVYTISPIAETAQNRPSRQGHFIVRNVTVDGSMQDGISTQGAGDIWIENCTVRRVKHKGLHWGTTCDRVIIRGNLCEDCGSAEYEKTSANGGTGGMYFCYNNHRVIIVGNTLRRCHKGVFGFSGNEVGASDTDSIVADNLFDDCALAGIRLEAGLHINVTGNRFVNFTGGGVPILTVREWDGLQYSIVSDNVCEGFRSGGAAVRNPIDLTCAVGTVARNNAVTPELRPLPPVAAPPAWRAPTDGEEDVTAYGAVGDGRTDDTAAIARAIAAAQASGRPVLFPKTAGGSVYCVTEPVVLASKLDVRAFPLATVRSATTVLVIRGREVTVENLGVHSLSNDAIVIERSEDVRLRHIRVEGAAENGLVVKGGARITLEDALVRQAKRFGVLLTDGCAKVTLVANLFASCGDAKKGTGGCLEFAGSEETLVTCNHLADSPCGLFGSGAGDERATVSLNTFSRLSVAGALLGGGRGLRFYGNRFLRFARRAVPVKAVSPADGRPFRESVIEANGIASFEGAKLRKKANPDAYVNEEGAIVLRGAKDVKVVGNCLRADTTVHDPANPNTPSGSVEIRVTDSTDCTVAENVVSPATSF